MFGKTKQVKEVNLVKKVNLDLRDASWAEFITVDLSIERKTPELLSSYPDGADCIVYLWNCNGVATIYLNDITGHSYQMGTYYSKIRCSFKDLYIKNTAQPKFCCFLVGRGDIVQGN